MPLLAPLRTPRLPARAPVARMVRVMKARNSSTLARAVIPGGGVPQPCMAKPSERVLQRKSQPGGRDRSRTPARILSRIASSIRAPASTRTFVRAVESGFIRGRPCSIAEWGRHLQSAREGLQVPLERAPAGISTVVAEQDGGDSDVDWDRSGPSRAEQDLSRRTRILLRSARRQAKHSGPATAGELGVLEQNAVTPRVALQYDALVRALLSWTGLPQPLPGSDAVVDGRIVDYLTHLYMSGFGTSVGEETLARLLHSFVDFQRMGHRKLPRSWRALRGWRRLAPPRSRVPEAFPVIAAVASTLALHQHLDMSFFVLIAFGLYLRPSEGMQLRSKDLVAPISQVSQKWSFVICPEEAGLVSKTGSSDDTIIWDTKGLEWLSGLFPVLKRKLAPHQKIWSFDYPALTTAMRRASRALGVSLTPYQLRHSGPSWDRLQNHRSLTSIQKRGRWRSFQSVTRYEKAGRVLQRYESYTLAQRSFFERCLELLPDVMSGRVAPPRPPPLPQPWTSSLGVPVSRKPGTASAAPRQRSTSVGGRLMT